MLRLPVPKSSRHAAALAAVAVACATSPVRVSPVTEHEASTASAPPVEETAAEDTASDEQLPEPVLDDGSEDSDDSTLEDAASRERAHPLDGWNETGLREAVRNSLDTLGSISLGQPSAGSLVNAVRAEDGPLFKAQNPEGAFGTTETVEYLCAAIREVHARFPETPALALGHISAKNGGPLSPHMSHQSGRDVDISFYYKDGSGWYARGTRDNLDLDRTWAFVRALVTETDVDMILIDQSIQGLLEKRALELGEDPSWVRGLFHGGPNGLRRIVRHAPGHATHLHIRFYNPVAQETGRRVGGLLTELGIRKAPTSFIRHRTRKGDTLGKLAKRYGTTIPAIKAANGLRTSKIRDNRDYRIPVAGKPSASVGTPLKFPPRRLPPSAGPEKPSRRAEVSSHVAP